MDDPSHLGQFAPAKRRHDREPGLAQNSGSPEVGTSTPKIQNSLDSAASGALMKQFLTRTRKFIFAALAGASAAFAVPNLAMADEVDWAVDAVVTVGSIAGVPLGRSEAGVAKVLVRCAVSGKTLFVCSREIVLAQIPETARPIAACIVGGREAIACARDEALRHLPAGSQPIAACVTQGRKQRLRYRGNAEATSG